MKNASSGASLLMLVTAVVIWGTLGLFRRYIPLSSALLAFVRGAVGAGFLLAWMALRRKPFDRTFPRRLWALLLLSGALIGVNWILLFEAYSYTTVATATLCYYMAPVLVVLLSPLVLGESLPPVRLLWVGTAVLGMVFVSGVPENGLPRAGELRGILLGLAAAVLYASVVMLNKRLAGVGTYERTILQLAAAAAVLVPYLLATEDLSALTLTPRTAGLLLVLGVVHTGLAYALYFGSIERLRAQTVALFSYLDPVTAILLSALVLGERLTPLGALGAALVLGSTIAGEVWGARRETAP